MPGVHSFAEFSKQLFLTTRLRWVRLVRLLRPLRGQACAACFLERDSQKTA